MKWLFWNLWFYSNHKHLFSSLSLLHIYVSYASSHKLATCSVCSGILIVGKSLYLFRDQPSHLDCLITLLAAKTELSKCVCIYFVMSYSDSVTILQICRMQRLLNIWLSCEIGWILEMLEMPFLEMFHGKGHILIK